MNASREIRRAAQRSIRLGLVLLTAVAAHVSACGNPPGTTVEGPSASPGGRHPLSEPLLAIPETPASWAALQQGAADLAQQGDAAAGAVTEVLVQSLSWRKSAVAEALIDRQSAGLEAPTLAVLAQLGDSAHWVGTDTTLTAALDRCVARLPPDVTGPTLAQMMSRSTPLAERAAHHFASHPPKAADALLETLMRSTPDAEGRQRLARTMLRLPAVRTATARAHNAMRRADLLVALAFLDVEPAISTTPLFQDSVVGELMVRLLLVPQKELGAQQKFPPAIARYPSARSQLRTVLQDGSVEDQHAVARMWMGHQPSKAEVLLVLSKVESGTLSPEVLTEGAEPWMQTGLLAGMADPERPMEWRRAAATLLSAMAHPDGEAFLAAHPAEASTAPAPPAPADADPRRFIATAPGEAQSAPR